MTGLFLPPVIAWVLDCAMALAAWFVPVAIGIKVHGLSGRKWLAWPAGLLAAGAIIIIFAPVHAAFLTAECRGSIAFYDCTHPEPLDY